MFPWGRAGGDCKKVLTTVHYLLPELLLDARTTHVCHVPFTVVPWNGAKILLLLLLFLGRIRKTLVALKAVLFWWITMRFYFVR